MSTDALHTDDMADTPIWYPEAPNNACISNRVTEEELALTSSLAQLSEKATGSSSETKPDVPDQQLKSAGISNTSSGPA